MALEKSSLVDLKGLNEVYKTLTAQYEALIGVVGSALGVTEGTVLNTDSSAQLNVTRPINIDTANINSATLGGLDVTGNVTLGSSNADNVTINSYTHVTGTLKAGTLKAGTIEADSLSVLPSDPLKVKSTSVPDGDKDKIYLLGVKDTRTVDVTYTVDVPDVGTKVYMDSKGTLTATDVTITSSRKAKENIQSTHVKGTDLIDAVDVVDFTYINDPEKVPHVGFIAEDTDPLLSTPGRNKMDYTNCIGILLKAVQELSARVKELEAAK